MIAYNTQEWHDLFVAVAGAAAALDGLLFVAVSLNVQQILKVATLPPLAARSLAVLLALLLMSIFALTPGQSSTVLGVEITVLGLVLTIGVTASAFRTHRPLANLQWTVPTLALAALSTGPMLIGGISLIAGAGGGLYWLDAELITGFSIAIYYAWILLVEILR